MPCDGYNVGQQVRIKNGNSYVSVPIRQDPDIVPEVRHNAAAQTSAIDNGQMDGWTQEGGCQPPSYTCITGYEPSQIPNLAALATHFAVSDRTFSMDPVPSWGAHLELVAQTLDGFVGDNPLWNGQQKPKPPPNAPGWGCDSYKDAEWASTPGATPTEVPACIPDPSCSTCSFPPNNQYGGAYRPTPVQYVPTIMDRLDAAGLSWKLYTEGGTPEDKAPGGSYIWSICPSFAECIYSNQNKNMQLTSQFINDATNGTLPNFSILLPTSAEADTSQHNGTSMAEGDNWLGYAMNALMQGPDWDSTAVFLSYDDCGCFYDHVPPPNNWGVRVPMVIISPYAKSGYTDSNDATFASMLAYMEHTFDQNSGNPDLVPPLTDTDRTAYDYSDAFDYTQAPLAPIQMYQTAIPPDEQAYLDTHPADPGDPT
jgi:phospholipase C